jgi:hypothetical protein
VHVDGFDFVCVRSQSRICLGTWEWMVMMVRAVKHYIASSPVFIIQNLALRDFGS